MSLPIERCFLFLKPDCIESRHCGEVIARLENVRELVVTHLKIAAVTREQLHTHYAHVTDRSFYPAMEAFLLSMPLWQFVVNGSDGLIGKIRKVLGPTDSAKALPGTIRGDFGSRETVFRNIAHASDSTQAADRELAIFFPEIDGIG